MKYFSGDINPDPYPLHSTSTYTCGVTITSKVHSGKPLVSCNPTPPSGILFPKKEWSLFLVPLYISLSLLLEVK